MADCTLVSPMVAIYTPGVYMVYGLSGFRPRKPVRLFRDLEAYQKVLEGAVVTSPEISLTQ